MNEIALQVLLFFADPEGRRSFGMEKEPPFTALETADLIKVRRFVKMMNAIGLLEKASNNRGAIYRITHDGQVVLSTHNLLPGQGDS